MTKLHRLGSAAIFCGGALILSGCHHDAATAADGVPIPAPHAGVPAETQIQQIESDPHIPAAQKPAIEAQIQANNKNLTAPMSAKAP